MDVFRVKARKLNIRVGALEFEKERLERENFKLKTEIIDLKTDLKILTDKFIK